MLGIVPRMYGDALVRYGTVCAMCQQGLQRNILDTCKVKHVQHMLAKEDVKAAVKSDRTRMAECAKAVMSLLDMLEQFSPRTE